MFYILEILSSFGTHRTLNPILVLDLSVPNYYNIMITLNVVTTNDASGVIPNVRYYPTRFVRDGLEVLNKWNKI